MNIVAIKEPTYLQESTFFKVSENQRGFELNAYSSSKKR